MKTTKKKLLATSAYWTLKTWQLSNFVNETQKSREILWEAEGRFKG